MSDTLLGVSHHQIRRQPETLKTGRCARPSWPRSRTWSIGFRLRGSR